MQRRYHTVRHCTIPPPCIFQCTCPMRNGESPHSLALPRGVVAPRRLVFAKSPHLDLCDLEPLAALPPSQHPPTGRRDGAKPRCGPGRWAIRGNDPDAPVTPAGVDHGGLHSSQPSEMVSNRTRGAKGEALPDAGPRGRPHPDGPEPASSRPIYSNQKKKCGRAPPQTSQGSFQGKYPMTRARNVGAGEKPPNLMVSHDQHTFQREGRLSHLYRRSCELSLLAHWRSLESR